jgi:hypothetical protein
MLFSTERPADLAGLVGPVVGLDAGDDGQAAPARCRGHGIALKTILAVARWLSDSSAERWRSGLAGSARDGFAQVYGGIGVSRIAAATFPTRPPNVWRRRSSAGRLVGARGTSSQH